MESGEYAALVKASLEESSLDEVLQMQFDLLRKALCFHEVLSAHLKELSALKDLKSQDSFSSPSISRRESSVKVKEGAEEVSKGLSGGSSKIVLPLEDGKVEGKDAPSRRNPPTKNPKPHTPQHVEEAPKRGFPFSLPSFMKSTPTDGKVKSRGVDLGLGGGRDKPIDIDKALMDLQEPFLSKTRSDGACGLEAIMRSPSIDSSDTPKYEQKPPLFPNTGGSVKARVLAALQRPEYRVESLYKDRGCCAYIASSSAFQTMTLLVIGFNTIWIAVETDNNKAEILIEAPLIFQIVDNLFCFYFTFEILTRFGAFKVKAHALQDAWFVFDLSLVSLMIWETWISVGIYLFIKSQGGDISTEGGGGAGSIFRILRIFRLTRVARMARLLRGMPELMVLVKGMLEGIRSVSATMLLLMLIIYVFAVLFTQLLSGTEVGEGCFDTVPQAMNCLLLQGVFPDQSSIIEKMLSADLRYYLFMLIYLVFVSLTIMNMLIAVLCEVVSVVAQVDKEENSMRDLKSKIGDVLQSLGVPEGSQEVSKEHFSNLTDNPEAMRSLHDVGVDVVALVELADFLFQDEDALGLAQFVEVVLQFRGSNTATVKDIVDMRSFLRRELEALEDKMSLKRRGSSSRHLSPKGPASVMSVGRY